MDDRYVRLQSVIDDLIAERDRVIDEALEMDKLVLQARAEAAKWRDAYAAEIGEPVGVMALPWEEGANDHD